MRSESRVRQNAETLAVIGQELAHRGFRAQRLQQLNKRPTNRDHRLLDTLVLNGLAIKRFDVVTRSIAGKRGVEIMNGDRHVIEVEELHRTEAISGR
jgi:hypothetical protein